MSWCVTALNPIGTRIVIGTDRPVESGWNPWVTDLTKAEYFGLRHEAEKEAARWMSPQASVVLSEEIDRFLIEQVIQT